MLGLGVEAGLGPGFAQRPCPAAPLSPELQRALSQPPPLPLAAGAVPVAPLPATRALSVPGAAPTAGPAGPRAALLPALRHVMRQPPRPVPRVKEMVWLLQHPGHGYHQLPPSPPPPLPQPQLQQQQQAQLPARLEGRPLTVPLSQPAAQPQPPSPSAPAPVAEAPRGPAEGIRMLARQQAQQPGIPPLRSSLPPAQTDFGGHALGSGTQRVLPASGAAANSSPVAPPLSAFASAASQPFPCDGWEATAEPPPPPQQQQQQQQQQQKQPGHGPEQEQEQEQQQGQEQEPPRKRQRWLAPSGAPAAAGSAPLLSLPTPPCPVPSLDPAQLSVDVRTPAAAPRLTCMASSGLGGQGSQQAVKLCAAQRAQPRSRRTMSFPILLSSWASGQPRPALPLQPRP